MQPSIDELYEAFLYDATTGIFRKRGTGKIIGFKHFGYLVLNFNRKKLRAHRVAWAMTYGQWPDGDIDHANRDGTDNRIENLRPATPSQNTANTVRPNAIGRRGIRVTKYGYKAAITCQRRQFGLGTFSSLDEASHAYNKAAIFYFGEFAVLNPIGVDKGAAGLEGGAGGAS